MSGQIETRRVQRFEAEDDAGRIYWISGTAEYIVYPSRDPGPTQEAYRASQLVLDGTDEQVEQIKWGEYRITRTGMVLRSGDPDAV